MDRVSYPDFRSYGNDFDGYKKKYIDDWNNAKAKNKTLKEADFIKVHVLPQFEELYSKNTDFTERLVTNQFITFLKQRLKEVDFDIEEDLDNAKTITDIFDRLHWWESRLSDYQRLVVRKNGNINIEINFSSLYSNYGDAARHQIESIESHIKQKNQVSKETKSRPPKQKNAISYQWQGNAEKELPELYKRLCNAKCIDDNQVDLKAFTAIFTGQPTETIKPIIWCIQKNLLPYFIDGLMTKSKISKLLQNDIWAIAKLCFIDANNLSQLKDLYTNNNNSKPKNHKLIDDILNTL
jgi:hypothetical protein